MHSPSHSGVHHMQQLFDALRTGDRPWITNFLSTGVRLKSILAVAAENNMLAGVEILLAHDACVHDERNWALCLAAENGLVAMTELLLRFGADPKANNSKALQLACIFGHHGVIDILYGVSEPETALLGLLAVRGEGQETDWLRQRMQSESDKQVLTTSMMGVEAPVSSLVRKM